jgi:hypothetical protein
MNWRKVGIIVEQYISEGKNLEDVRCMMKM